jgi:hypothetical protein
VDDFAIKYTKKEDAQHLINTIQKDFTITIDWDATKYIGLTVKWDYMNRKVYLHMPGYLTKTLQRFKDEIPKSKQKTPHPHVAPQYGIKQEFTEEPNESPPLGKDLFISNHIHMQTCNSKLSRLTK